MYASDGRESSKPSRGHRRRNTSLAVNGTAAFTASNGSISLANAGNAFNGAVTLTTSAAGNAALANNRALSLGNVAVSNGALNITAAGNISQAARMLGVVRDTLASKMKKYGIKREEC